MSIERELNPETRFNFECQAECMGKCCRNIDIWLDPWDVETIARELEMTTRDFINRYCYYELDSATRWPSVRFRHAAEGPCYFLLDDGRCRIYHVRPRNCRTYPLGRAVRFERSGEEVQIVEKLFMVDPMEFCLGHNASRTWTVKEWLEDCGAYRYYELCDLYLEVIDFAKKKLKCGEWMNNQTARIIMPLIYGADALRSRLGSSVEGVSHEELYRRRMKALKLVLTDLAAFFLHSPSDQQVEDVDTAPMVSVNIFDRIKKILLAEES